MFELFKEHNGPLTVNGKPYKNVIEAQEAFNKYKGGLTIVLNATTEIEIKKLQERKEKAVKSIVYQIQVRRYMTNYEPDFFLHKMNPEGPMPYVIMHGRKLEETAGLVKMECWAELGTNQTTVCVRCGRALSNPLSQYLSLGPECGAAEHMAMLSSGEDLESVRAKLREKISNIKWTGWIVKSAIQEAKEI